MVATPADEHAYLLKRSADHRALADRAALSTSRMLHERFAAVYARRAAELRVEED
ncbi:hypothetical protein [uncultured Sphingomonas sp.]|uniref:hypothetical protein n=1 Tax=uncultured Sphingomonas sp. TaxID=158754 RepID=UPI0025D6739B|nr:hypothetical protein [uncultured Sphingomonas sp.]